MTNPALTATPRTGTNPKTGGSLLITRTSIRRRIAHMLEGFGCDNALDWPETHPIDLDSLQMVELALHIEAAFDIDFRDDLIPPAATIEDFANMVETANLQKAKNNNREATL